MRYSDACLLAQGFSISSEDDRVTSMRAVRFTPAVSVSVILVGLVMQSPWVMWFMMVVAVTGVLFPRGMVIDVLYNKVARLVGARSFPATPSPRRFSYSMSAVLLGVAGMGFFTGNNVVGWVAGGLVVVGGIVLATSLFCTGSWIYSLLLKVRHI